MSKIKSIQLKNFKFFTEEETLLLNGKHLLLYGENGSGKSSIFWGIYTLLEASMKSPIHTAPYFELPQQNESSLVNIHALEISDIHSHQTHCDSYIQVITDDNQAYKLSKWETSICGDTQAIESRKATDFINYQSLFDFQRSGDSGFSNLYQVFTRSVLPYISFSSFTLKGKILSNVNQMWQEYKEGPGKTRNRRGVKIQVYKSSPEYKNFLKFESHFNSEFNKLIDFINGNSSTILTQFGYTLEFKLEYIPPTYQKKDKNYTYTPFGIKFIITKYDGKTVNITRAHSFLNEAKITAIAIAIRLSILKYRINTASPTALQTLILDDIMISLDMSNRDHLINYLLKEFSPKYQLIFFTHDKSLYHFVYHKIQQRSSLSAWTLKEMYVKRNKNGYDQPILIEGEISSYKKAQKYFAAKDYETTSLYVRKTLEESVGNLIPDELKRQADNSFISLQALWKKFKELYSPAHDIITLFEDSKLLILNPAAHFQRLPLPIYAKELEMAFELVEKINKINNKFKKVFLFKDQLIEFDSPSLKYQCRFKLKNNLEIEKYDNVIIRIPKCYDIYFEYNGIPYYDPATKTTDRNHPLKTATPDLFNFVRKNPFGVTEHNFLTHAKSNGILLIELLEYHNFSYFTL